MQKGTGMDQITDYITGKTVTNTGAEMNRQAMEKFLVEKKGFLPTDIAVDVPITFPIEDTIYRSRVDLLVSVDDQPLMAVKCAAGSLGSREREILAEARLVMDHQIPFAVATDGKTAMVLDTLTGKKKAEGLDAIPSRKKAAAQLQQITPQLLPKRRTIKERLIFRSYDGMNVNIQKRDG